MKIILILLATIVGLFILGWVGLRIKPAPFAAFPQEQPELETIPLPEGLPEPVERFYRQLYGERVPVIESAVISGRARMRPVGSIFLPARFRFTHLAGQGYRHYIEATFFGFPIMRVNERYLDGKGLMELPFGTFEGQNINQGANLGLWGESMWYPAIFMTDERVHWEAVDEETALLYVPYEDGEETMIVRFDPETGLPHVIEAMRFKGEDSQAKTLWIPRILEWGRVNGILTMSKSEIVWFDQGSPWVVFEVDEMLLNVDVGEYIRARGE